MVMAWWLGWLALVLAEDEGKVWAAMMGHGSDRDQRGGYGGARRLQGAPVHGLRVPTIARGGRRRR